MKKISTLIALAFAASPLLAQFSMSAGDVPQSGDNQYFTRCDTTGISAGSPGTGQTWDFSAVVPQGAGVTVNYGAPSGHPNGATFPGSNLVQSYVGFYKFFNATTDSLELTGERSVANTPCPYVKTPTLYIYPMNFGYMHSDSATGTYADGFISSVNRKGTYTVEFDGSGTLITPFATYNNVNRIRTLGVFRDSSWTGAAESDVLLLRYEWYVQGTRTPRMIVTFTSVSINAGPPQIGKDVWYADQNIGLADGQGDFGMTVSPNPAKGQASVRYQLPASDEVSLTLLNSAGQTVRVIRDGFQASGDNAAQIDLQGLASGLYLIRLQAGDQAQTSRLVVQ
jgi:Secretion system C-terminal sorting domain